jgi:hypothetical protein
MYRVNLSEYPVWCQGPMQLDMSGMKGHKEKVISSPILFQTYSNQKTRILRAHLGNIQAEEVA